MIQRPYAASGRSVGYTATWARIWFPCGLVIGSPKINVNITNIAEKRLSSANARQPHPSNVRQGEQVAKTRSIVRFANHRFHDLGVPLHRNHDRPLFAAVTAAGYHRDYLTFIRQRHAYRERTIFAELHRFAG